MLRLTLAISKTMHLSSRYKITLNFTSIDISITQIKNSEGPSIDPCGTSNNMLEISEKEFSSSIKNIRFD